MVAPQILILLVGVRVPARQPTEKSISANKIKGQTHFCPFAPFSLFSPKTTYKSPAILKTYATERGCSIRRAVHFLAAAPVAHVASRLVDGRPWVPRPPSRAECPRRGRSLQPPVRRL